MKKKKSFSKFSKIKKAIDFSARMRLYLHTAERTGVVDSLIHKLGLDSVANKGLDRITLDQSKKVTIAVELVSSPG